jgi:hypothetical protein
MIPSIPQQNTTISLPPASLAGSAFKKVPDTLISMIQNYIPFKATARNMHLVVSTWRHLKGNDGHLDLRCSNITDANLARTTKEYNNDRKLTSLNLSYCKKITDKGLEHLKELALTRLDLSYCEQITDIDLEHLAGLPLTQLNLSGCKKITDKGLEHLTGFALTQLNLTSCWQITVVGLKHLAELPLTQLDLSEGCINITDDSLAHLAKLTFLTQLNLSWCRNTTDAGLAHLAKLPLTKLNLCWCEKITDAGLEHLSKLPLIELNLFRSNVKDPENTSRFHLIRNYLNQSNLLGTGLLSADNPRLHNLIAEYAL